MACGTAKKSIRFSNTQENEGDQHEMRFHLLCLSTRPAPGKSVTLLEGAQRNKFVVGRHIEPSYRRLHLLAWRRPCGVAWDFIPKQSWPFYCSRTVVIIKLRRNSAFIKATPNTCLYILSEVIDILLLILSLASSFFPELNELARPTAARPLSPRPGE